jgi:hypothetical protein
MAATENKDHAQVPLAPGAADVADDVPPLQHPAVQVAQCRQRLVGRTPGKLPLLDEVDQVRPHLFLPEQFRALSEVLGELGDVVHVQRDRLGGEVPQPISSIMRFLSGVIEGSFRQGERETGTPLIVPPARTAGQNPDRTAQG